MKNFKLAVDAEHAIETFGPAMSLSDAQHYQKKLKELGKDVMVVNIRAE